MATFVFLLLLIAMLLFWDGCIRVFYRARACAVSEHRSVRMAELAFKTSSAFLGHRISIEHSISPASLPPSFLLVTNHQSLMDIPALIYCLPGRRLRFVAKSELFRGVPLISLLLRLQGHARVYRSAETAATARSLVRLPRRSADGVCPVVFPEGTRSRTGEVGRFRPGAVRKILETRALPVVVAALDGGWRAAEAGQMASGLQNCLYRCKVLAVAGQPQSRKDIGAVVESAEEMVQRKVSTWRLEEQKKGPPTV